MLKSAWSALDRALARINTFLDYLLPLMLFGMGGVMLYASAFKRLPAPHEMVQVSGYVRHYNVVLSRADIPSTINFVLWNDETPYWTDEIDDSWAKGRLDGTKLLVVFYTEPGPVFRMGKVKTFGLTLNGRVLTSLEDDLKGESKVLRYAFPLVALFAILVAYWRWPRERPKTLQPDGSFAETRVDKGFALNWERLSPRRKFIRTCWMSGFAIVIVLLTKRELLWILGVLAFSAAFTIQTYRAWKSHSEE